MRHFERKMLEHRRDMSNQEADRTSIRVDHTATSSLAVVITGLLRSLLSEPMIQSFRLHVTARSDVHVVISGKQNAAVASKVQDAFNPVQLRFISANEDNAPRVRHCQIKSYVGGRMLAAWMGIRHAYEDVVKSESRRGQPYAWIMRLRTDTVLLQDVPVLSWDKDFVYIPGGGMNANVYARFTNDHLFFCPRPLCRPYFHLLELWESPLCDKTGKAPIGVFASNLSSRLVPNVLPTRPFSVPPPRKPPYHQWYILARYSLDGDCSSVPKERLNAICGLVHEIDIPYVLARGNEEAGVLVCDYNLLAWVRLPPAVREAYSNCQTQSEKYSSCEPG
eukprot:CAMPEP_0119300850 /NCGR_PEP_ID=MMETSP1333-20130426/2738_1 /TAXON_ID=418940 /ORGANISM="Scyphosphaera apsteinii, Strain RCC1455" /LENGTH=334 /DNA_ID=CAMNT_0007302757 /DNA_START=74 /DNA_END=1074 /DNA_ORIENTATION=+